MDMTWCSAADRGLVQPDLVIYLRADAEVLSKRANFGEERFEKVEFQRKVQSAFEKLFEQEQGVRVVEVGERSLGEVQEEVSKLVDHLFL
jgi:dTMP kinase